MTNLRRLACKFDLKQSERKSSQVNASARKSWPNEVASRPKFSTCGYLRLAVWPGLYRSFIRETSFLLSPGQTESQVDPSFQLASTCDPVWPGLRALALTCDDLRSLWSRSNLQASRRKFFTVWAPNPSQRKLSNVH